MAGQPYESMRVATERGPVQMRLYDDGSAIRGIVAVGGAGGGFDTPARGLYERLGEAAPELGLALLRVRFRDPHDLEEAIADVQSGIAALERQGMEEVGLLGHSLGGAVVIASAAQSPRVRTVVTLASQTYGAEAVARLTPRSILLLHGTADPVLPATCSTQLYAAAREPKEIDLYPGAGHMLDEVAEAVFVRVRDWLVRPEWSD